MFSTTSPVILSLHEAFADPRFIRPTMDCLPNPDQAFFDDTAFEHIKTQKAIDSTRINHSTAPDTYTNSGGKRKKQLVVAHQGKWYYYSFHDVMESSPWVDQTTWGKLLAKAALKHHRKVSYLPRVATGLQVIFRASPQLLFILNESDF